MKKDELMLHEMKYDNGGLDLKLGGQTAMLFMQNLIELLKINGGENFLTITLEQGENKYSITIQNCNGVDTPSEKLQCLDEKVSKMTEVLEWIRDSGTDYRSINKAIEGLKISKKT